MCLGEHIGLLHIAFCVPGATALVYVWPDYLERVGWFVVVFANPSVPVLLAFCVCQSKWEVHVSLASVAVLELYVRRTYTVRVMWTV